MRPHERIETQATVACIRAPDAIDDAAFLRRAIDHQVALARIARPRRTRYPPPTLTDDTRPIYENARGYLKGGYAPAERAAVFHAALEPCQHAVAREIDGIARIVETKKMPDGQDAEDVLVVFPDRETAVRERRPLLDVGARVRYLGRALEFVDVEE